MSKSDLGFAVFGFWFKKCTQCTVLYLLLLASDFVSSCFTFCVFDARMEVALEDTMLMVATKREWALPRMRCMTYLSREPMRQVETSDFRVLS